MLRRWDVPLCMVPGPCCCSGHCYTTGHRYWSGCNETSVVVTSRAQKYCTSCKCVILGCDAPKFQGDTCKKHTRLLEQLSTTLTLVRNHRQVLSELIPCDVTSFAMTYPEIRGDLAIVIVVAYVKEPFCVSALLEEVRAHQRTNGERYSAADFRQWLTRMIVQASGAPHSEEMSQLCPQGVGRVIGAPLRRARS